MCCHWGVAGFMMMFIIVYFFRSKNLLNKHYPATQQQKQSTNNHKKNERSKKKCWWYRVVVGWKNASIKMLLCIHFPLSDSNRNKRKGLQLKVCTDSFGIDVNVEAAVSLSFVRVCWPSPKVRKWFLWKVKQSEAAQNIHIKGGLWVKILNMCLLLHYNIAPHHAQSPNKTSNKHMQHKSGQKEYHNKYFVNVFVWHKPGHKLKNW